MNTVSKIVAFTERKQHGDLQIIAKQTGYSHGMVSNTLRGRRSNEEIVDYAFNLVKDRLTNLQRLQMTSQLID